MTALETRAIAYVRYLACVANGGQTSIRDAPTVAVLECVGFVVGETANSLSLASDIHERGDIRRCLAIPKPSILERVPLGPAADPFGPVPRPGPGSLR